MVFYASSSKALNDLSKHPWIQFAGPDVIEKKERLGSQNGDIINTVVDEVLADGVVSVHREGNLQLSSHSIDA